MSPAKKPMMIVQMIPIVLSPVSSWVRPVAPELPDVTRADWNVSQLATSPNCSPGARAKRLARARAPFIVHVVASRVPVQKTRPATPHQRRRHAAHHPRCPHLHAGAIQTARDKAAMATAGRIAAWRGRRCRLSKQVELALFYDAK